MSEQVLGMPFKTRDGHPVRIESLVNSSNCGVVQCHVLGNIKEFWVEHFNLALAEKFVRGLVITSTAQKILGYTDADFERDSCIQVIRSSVRA